MSAQEIETLLVKTRHAIGLGLSSAALSYLQEIETRLATLPAVTKALEEKAMDIALHIRGAIGTALDKHLPLPEADDLAKVIIGLVRAGQPDTQEQNQHVLDDHGECERCGEIDIDKPCVSARVRTVASPSGGNTAHDGRSESEESRNTFEQWAESEGWLQEECPESYAQGREIWEAATAAATTEVSAMEQFITELRECIRELAHTAPGDLRDRAIVLAAKPVSSSETSLVRSVSDPNPVSGQPDETAKLREEKQLTSTEVEAAAWTLAKQIRSKFDDRGTPRFYAVAQLQGIIAMEFHAVGASLLRQLAESKQREAAALAAVRDKDEALRHAKSRAEQGLAALIDVMEAALAKQPDASALEEYVRDKERLDWLDSVLNIVVHTHESEGENYTHQVNRGPFSLGCDPDLRRALDAAMAHSQEGAGKA